MLLLLLTSLQNPDGGATLMLPLPILIISVLGTMYRFEDRGEAPSMLQAEINSAPNNKLVIGKKRFGLLANACLFKPAPPKPVVTGYSVR